MQSLNGKLAALSSFLSKGADLSLPLFKTLKGCVDKTFQWILEAEAAFQKLKEFMEVLPTHTAPIKGEVLFMYIATSSESISVVLMAERERKQIPIYFVSRVLQGAELDYPELEKIVLALIHAARHLRRYFQAHPITELTDKPIKQILSNPEKSGRIAKWSIELGEHEIEYKGRKSIKGEVLAYFLAEIPSEPPQKKEMQKQKPSKEGMGWKLYTDGASSSDGSGAGLMLVSP